MIDGSAPPPLLLFDGECAFCHRTVRFILRHERLRTLEFAPLAGPTAQRILSRRPDRADTDAVMWVDRAPDSTVRSIEVRSAAALRVMGYLGGWWSLLTVLRIIPRFLRDAVYDALARHRHRLGGECSGELWPPDEQSRFLDLE